jgi:hypothetical protein
MLPDGVALSVVEIKRGIEDGILVCFMAMISHCRQEWNLFSLNA